MKFLTLLIFLLCSTQAFSASKVQCEFYKLKKGEKTVLSVIDKELEYNFEVVDYRHAEVYDEYANEYYYVITVSNNKIKSAALVHTYEKRPKSSSVTGNEAKLSVSIKKYNVHFECEVIVD